MLSASVTKGINLKFNTADSTTMHIDLNSCFASVEQQANPLLRGKPIAVAAYVSNNGCILAASVEAKIKGVKTGMRVKEGKALCPALIVLPPDAPKYRVVHKRLAQLLKTYTMDLHPKSIDEFVLNFKGYPILQTKTMQGIGIEIKGRIKEEVGDWLRVSIGIGPNRFLAKTAAGLKKPDGLEEINYKNFEKVYSLLDLEDLHGIAQHNAARLKSVGIYTVPQMYESPIWKLKVAFQSIAARYWYTRLRGWEIDAVEFGRRSYGNSYSIPSILETPQELAPILTKLVEKMSFRLRRAGFVARGIHLAVRSRDWEYWHKGLTLPRDLYDSREIFKESYRLLKQCPLKKPVGNLAVSCFDLKPKNITQLELFDNTLGKQDLVKAKDEVNTMWGDFVVSSARMIATQKYVPDRIAFGNVKEIEELVFS